LTVRRLGSDGNNLQGRVADIARIAHLSSDAVSAVLARDANVPAEVRVAVARAMVHLGLDSDGVDLGRRVASIIGVVAPKILTSSERLLLAEMLLAAGGDSCALAMLELGNERRLVLHPAVSGSSELGQLSGVISFIPASEVEVILPKGEQFLPWVQIGTDRDPDGLTVGVAEAASITRLIDHLLEGGRDTVWHIAGPREDDLSRRKIDAWRTALEERGRQVPPIIEGDGTAHSGFICGLELAQNPSVAAIFVACDEMAVGVLRALNESGRLVPKDVAVAGFGDARFSANLVPPLTSIRIPYGNIARFAVSMAVAGIESGATATGFYAVPGEIVIRKSSAS